MKLTSLYIALVVAFLMSGLAMAQSTSSDCPRLVIGIVIDGLQQ